MPRGTNDTIPSGTGKTYRTTTGDVRETLLVLNPNNGILYVSINTQASPAVWDFVVPSQSRAFLPGPWLGYGLYYVDQSGAGGSGNVTIYESDVRIQVPDYAAVGIARLAEATALDIAEGNQPANPGLGILRLWSPSTDQTLHRLLNTGADDAFVQAALAQTLTNKTFDASSNVVSRIGHIGPLVTPAASVGFNPIASGFAHAELIYLARTSDPVEAGIFMQLNGDTGAHYYLQRILADGSAIAAAENIGVSSISVGLIPGSGSSASLFGSGRVFIPDLSASTGGERPILTQFGDTLALTTTNIRTGVITFHWDSAGAITSILLFPGGVGATFPAGSQFWLYGYP